VNPSQTPQQIIQEAIDKISSMKKAVGVDPKWMNRTLSHLDNAFASSKLIIREGSLADSPEAQVHSETCSCPTGAVDRTCPVHGQK
jgi:hypothetical protein